MIRRGSDLVEVVSAHIDLRRSGTNWIGICPFHEERTPSFYVSAARQTFHCFSCGSTGNVGAFERMIKKSRNKTSGESKRQLSTKRYRAKLCIEK
ncbi:MAG: CHC2 zinc finger domain-containing protein [Nitrospiraceae bacterium]